MSDYSEHGTEPVDDAVTPDPPTEAEVREAQERKYPEQAATRGGIVRPDDVPVDDHGADQQQ
jgi:hypothetical protein